MNPPKFITFTGADEQTDVARMCALSFEYPIEWGILFSPKRQGAGRYPPFVTAMKLLAYAPALRLSAHLCGGYSADVIRSGGLPIYRQPFSIQSFLLQCDRVQLNTSERELNIAEVSTWGASMGLRVIYQTRTAFPDDSRVDWLFDASGGRGISPQGWPWPGDSPEARARLKGYAGGLNPDNVAGVVQLIGSAQGPGFDADENYYIDMETGVRARQRSLRPGQVRGRVPRGLRRGQSVMSVRILTGNCIDLMRTLPPESVDSIVTDPPYGIRFMGKAWDGTDIDRTHGLSSPDGRSRQRTGAAAAAGKYDLAPAAMRAFQEFSRAWAAEAFRVLKPGGHLLSFASTRTYHRMTSGIEDAGFEIRDQCIWGFGSGFPKSLNVSKAIDKAAGVDCTSCDELKRARPPATEEAKQWEGWGSALKPAWEPICLARKPLGKRLTLAANVLAFGTGALNIDGCRIATEDKLGGGDQSPDTKVRTDGWDRPWMQDEGAKAAHAARVNENVAKAEALGRWPANVLHDGSPEVIALFPREAGAASPVTGLEPSMAVDVDGGLVYGARDRTPGAFHNDTGSAARFFWCPKTSGADRHDGLHHPGQQFKTGSTLRSAENLERKGNHHPTVKPTQLMRYLCRLVTPPGGTVLDPFMGSGSTLKAAELEGFSAIGIELDPEYVAIARRRIASDAPLFADVSAGPATPITSAS